MVLDPTVRGYLEQSIDNAIKAVPASVKSLFDPKVRAEAHIQNQNDFVLGAAIGMVYQIGIFAILAIHSRSPSQEEISEVGLIIYRHLPELREAIFKAG
jgi:hypothetical protein